MMDPEGLGSPGFYVCICNSLDRAANILFPEGDNTGRRMCDTSMLEEKAMVQFLNRFTDYPFLVKWKDHEDG